MGDPGLRLQAHPPQLLGHHPGGALLAVGQLRVLVEIAAPVDHLLPLRGRRSGHLGTLGGLGGAGGQDQGDGAGQQAGAETQGTGHGRGSGR